MIELYVDALSGWLNQHPGWILISLACVAFIESLAIAGIVVPGVAILFAIAVVAGGADVPLFQALLAALTGAVAGDVLSFYLGYYYRDRLRRLWPISRFPEALESGARFFHKHGGKSVVVGRFVGPIRPVLPMVAGMFGMSPVHFVAINILSACAWAPAYILPGYLVGAAVNISPPLHWPALLGGLCLTLAAMVLLFRFISRRLQEGESWYDHLNRCHVLGGPHLKNKPMASLALLLFSVLALMAWTWSHIAYGAFNTLDRLWLEFATSLAVGPVRELFVAITAFGDERFLQISFTLATIVLVLARQWRAALMLALSGLSISLLTHAMKAFFAIMRPEVLINPVHSFAYPSGHTSGAMVLFGMLATILAERTLPAIRWKIYLAMMSPVLLIALSRIILGIHWFSDVIAGLLLGLTVCALARIAYWYSGRRFGQMPADTPSDAPHHRLWLSGLIIWLLAAGLYMALGFGEMLQRYALKTF